MPRIQQLDALVINKIAAGEVIERPASVVKELLENSVDALATRVDVEIGQGGTELIRVVDDGEGLHPEDFLLAVSSHATSKILSAEDLFQVQTMGFRGEALASIASVSRMRIRSRLQEASTGYELEINGGKVGELQECGCAAGTMLEVRNLFASTPVRRKFLKTHATEFGHISEQFARVAIAHPRLHAVLRHNTKIVYELPSTNRLIERLEMFHGSKLAEHLIWVESETDNIRLWGYVAHPSQSKSSRKSQYLFLNGRYIQDRALQHALSEAYRGLLMVGRQPIAFLFLEVPPDVVDVNVHPTKSEVRFRDGQQLYRQLLSTLRTKFLGMDLDSTFQLKDKPADKPATSQSSGDRQKQLELENEFSEWAQEKIGTWEPITPLLPSSDQPPTSTDAPGATPTPFSPLGFFESEIHETPNSAPRPTDTAPPTPDEQSEQESISESNDPRDPPPRRARIIQVLDCYLVMESEKGLVVVDQHALHERVLYEQFRNRVLSGAVESQKFLVPQTIEMSLKETALLLSHRELLGELGFGVEEFGNGTVLLTAYPVLLSRADHIKLIRDVVDQLDQPGQAPTRRDLTDQLLSMMACKAAIKAGHRLSVEEMEFLLAQRHLIDDSHHCPHGRPTALVLSREALDRQFGRLG